MVLRRSGSDLESRALQAAKGHGKAHNTRAHICPVGGVSVRYPTQQQEKNPILVQHLFGRPASCRVQHARNAGGGVGRN